VSIWIDVNFELFETIVLTRDVPEHGLRAGDLGAIVERYEPDGLEVEFVTATGQTQALMTLRTADVRKVGPSDMISVRSIQPAAQPSSNS
jgi:hypothetical protein